jgi:DNA polymerase II small subunit/DNA polymerase delta subunit B
MTFGSFFTQENNDIWVIFYPGNNDPSGDSKFATTAQGVFP